MIRGYDFDFIKRIWNNGRLNIYFRMDGYFIMR